MKKVQNKTSRQKTVPEDFMEEPEPLTKPALSRPIHP